jgi:hypothetical protein
MFGFCYRETRLSKFSGFAGMNRRNPRRPDYSFHATIVCGWDFRKTIRLKGTRVRPQRVFRNASKEIMVEASTQASLCLFRWVRTMPRSRTRRGRGRLQPDHNLTALRPPNPHFHRRTCNISHWHRLLQRSPHQAFLTDVKTE